MFGPQTRLLISYIHASCLIKFRIFLGLVIILPWYFIQQTSDFLKILPTDFRMEPH